MGDPDDSRIGGSRRPQTGETCLEVPHPGIRIAMPQDGARPSARGHAAAETAAPPIQSEKPARQSLTSSTQEP